MNEKLKYGLVLKGVGKSPSTGAIARMYDTHDNDKVIEKKVIYKDDKQFVKVNNNLYILNGKDKYASPVTGRYIDAHVGGNRYDVTKDIHGYTGYKQVEVYDKRRNITVVGRESSITGTGEEWFYTGDFGTIDKHFDSLNEARGFLEVNDVYGSSRGSKIPQGKRVGINKFPSKMEKQIYNRGWTPDANESDYKTWVDKEGNTIIMEKKGNQWVVYMGIYNPEKEDYTDKKLLGKYDYLTDAENVAFGLGSYSKRKKPITFGRTSPRMSPKSTPSGSGVGRGWHKQSARHSEASIKGWKGRR